VRAAAASGLLLALAAAGSAQAQSCAYASPTAVRCRFLLSRAQIVRVEARAVYAPGPDRPAVAFALQVDGRPCVVRQARPDRWSGEVRGACRVPLDAREHVAEASAQGAGTLDGVEVRLVPDARLAALPAEAATLAPHKPRRWPFWP
jgi:hypothetical protein